MFNVQYILLKKIDKKIQLSTQLPAKLSRLASPTTCCFYKEQQQKDQTILIEREHAIREAAAQMKQTAQAMDAKLVVLFFPFKEQVYWDVARQYTSDGDNISLQEIDAPVTAVMNFLDGENIDYCNLAPDLRAAAAKGADQLYLKAGAHWTASGNSQAAQSIAACLERLGTTR